MSLLPGQIIPQSIPIGKTANGDMVSIDHDWWLFFYNLALGTLSPTPGGTAVSDMEKILLNEIDSRVSDTTGGRGGGSGTVTTFSFTNANGFTGTVTNASTTPNLTLSSSFMVNPMTTQGDIIVGGSSGTPGRLGIGPAGTVPVSTGTALAYENPNAITGPYYWDYEDFYYFTFDFDNTPATVAAIFESMYTSGSSNTIAFNDPVSGNGLGTWWKNSSSTLHAYGFIGSIMAGVSFDTTESLQSTLSNAHRMKCRVVATNGTDLNNLSLFGLSSISASGVNFISTATSQGIFFRYQSNVSTTQITCVCKTGATGVGAETTATFTPSGGIKNVPHILELVATSTDAYFYCDGTLVATLTSNITTLGLGWYTGYYSQAGTSPEGYSIDWIKYQRPRVT